MKTEITQTPGEALRKNAKQLMEIGQNFALAAMQQAAMCRHAADVCPDCRRASDNLHYLATALGVVGGAALEGQTAEFYDVFIKFAVEHLPRFPKALARASLYLALDEFPEVIYEPEGNSADA